MLNGIIEGKEDLIINNLGTLESAVAGSLSFLSNPKYENLVYTTAASAVIVGKDFAAKKKLTTTIIRVENPYVSFTKLLEEYDKAMSYGKSGIENPSFIGEGTTYGEAIYIGAFTYIGMNVKIGSNVKIYPNVSIGDHVTIGDDTIIRSGVNIYENTVIGNQCIIHSGAVLGSDGFGFAPEKDGTYRKIPQLGKVILGDRVEIGANTVVDCATMDATIIADGTKIDNLVQIAHNVKIGKNTVIAGQVGIAGSTSIGDSCMLGGQSAIAGHLTISNKTTIGAQAGVSKSVVREGEILLGSPAFKISEFRRSHIIFKKLPEISERVSSLEKELNSGKE